MANTNSQEQLVHAQDIPGGPQKPTNAEQQALDQTLETLTSPAKATSHDFQAALDRLQVLEKGHIELTSLIQYVLQSGHGLLHS